MWKTYRILGDFSLKPIIHLFVIELKQKGASYRDFEVGCKISAKKAGIQKRTKVLMGYDRWNKMLLRGYKKFS